MAGGKVLQVDTPATGLYERPSTRAVAAFIGNMNFLDAQVVERTNGHVVVDVEGLGRRRLSAAAVPEHLGRRLCVAVRPERITVAPSIARPSRSSVSGKVRSRTYLGERSLLRIDADGCREFVIVSLPDDGSAVADGSSIWLDCYDSDLIFFEPT